MSTICVLAQFRKYAGTTIADSPYTSSVLVRLALSTLVAMSLACGSKEDKAKPKEQPAAKKKPAAPEPRKKAATAPPKLPEAKVKALLDGWLKSQNEGSFADYEKSYAKAFTGIKRSGEKTLTFDRKGWLADRKRMFEKKMQVSAADVIIKPGVESATVRFLQTWESGNYRDQGPKLLHLVLEAGELRIAKEEMLASVKTPALAGFVASLPKGGESVEAVKLPAKIIGELDALLADEETDDEVEWISRLSEDYLLVSQTGDHSSLGGHPDQPASGTISLLRRDKGQFVVASSVVGSGYGYSAWDLRDADGDGALDALLHYEWAFDHQAASGVVVLLTKQGKFFERELGESAGEGGEGGGVDVDDLCLVDDKDTWVLVQFKHEWSQSPGPSGDPAGDDFVHTSERSLVVERFAKGEWRSAKIYGHVVPWKAPKGKDRGCDDGDRVLLITPQDDDSVSDPTRLEGLSSTRSDALKKAAGIKSPRIIEL